MSARSSLWVNWIKRHLIRTGSFWSVKASNILGSWMWKKLLKYQDKAQDFHRMKIRSGRETSFWFDYWCPLGRLHANIGARGCIDLGIPAGSTVVVVLADHRRRRHRTDSLNKIEDEIDKLRSGDRLLHNDVPLWRGRGDQFKTFFSSKITWENIRSVSPLKAWYKGLWFSNATPKYSFISWLATLNRLSTGDRMLSWSPAINPECFLCHSNLESRDHIFFVCSFSSQIWHKLARRLLRNRFTTDYVELLGLLTRQQQTPTHEFILRYLFQCTIYLIWSERNRRKHGEVPLPSSTIIRSIDHTVRNRLSSLRQLGSDSMQDGLQIWFDITS